MSARPLGRAFFAPFVSFGILALYGSKEFRGRAGA